MRHSMDRQVEPKHDEFAGLLHDKLVQDGVERRHVFLIAHEVAVEGQINLLTEDLVEDLRSCETHFRNVDGTAAE
jgi:hypothetical protein